MGLLNAAAVLANHPKPMTYHGNLRWAEFLLEQSGGELGVSEYNDIAENGLFDGLGDWVFTGALHRDMDFGVTALREYATERHIDMTLAERMRAHAAPFVELATSEILDREPVIVGFTSTFMQNVPSLAVAMRIKECAPGVKILFGGGNCDGPMGVALHRNFPFIDYVVRGEGERPFLALLSALAEQGNFSAVPGLSWHGTDGAQHCNPQAPPSSADALPTPDFDDWFEHLGGSVVQEYIEPKLVLETSRGCWWGEKHHCTFCGLNGTLMKFRAKSPERVMSEIKSLVSRHQVLDLIMVDNIIDNSYFKNVLPLIGDLGWDLRVHYEVKSNLKPTDIAMLRHAGVAHVQPGIESLVTPVLKLMDKGVTAIQNIRTLRDCESAGLTVSWNWLYGFPGERVADYSPVQRQLRALAHLQPPAGVTRILLERFSPYFEDPNGAFSIRETAALYRHVYALSEVDLYDMVYLFDTEPAGLSDRDARSLEEALDAWSQSYFDSALEYVDTGDELLFEDRRVGWPASHYRIDDPRKRAAYLGLERGRSIPSLRILLEEQSVDLSDWDLQGWLADLLLLGLVFEEQGRWITLATSSPPIKVR